MFVVSLQPNPRWDNLNDLCVQCPGLPLTVHMQNVQYLCVLVTYVSYDACANLCALLLDLIVINTTGYFTAL